jgi:pimeloyl-ACP methyl ester carboxylesterase
MRVNWQTFEHDGRSCEGQVWLPDAFDKPRKSILFCPGFPGRGATIFEQRHAAILATQHGYAVIVLRHNGLKLESVDAPFMVNNASRLGARQGYIGGKPSTLLEWLWEPYTALNAIASQYDDIKIIGNSFGAVAMLWSLTRANANIEKVKLALCYAGAQGTVTDPAKGVMRVWNPAFLSNPIFTEKLALDDPMAMSRTMYEAYAELPEKVKVLPAHIALKYLVVLADEILKPSDTDEFKTAIGGRGEVILNDIDKPHPAYGLLAHDTPDYPTEKLLELLK